MQVISVLLAKTKLKTNKLHLATCYLNQSQLRFYFFVKCWSYKGHHCSGSDLAGKRGPGRNQLRRPFPGVNASWLCRVNIPSLVFSLNWWLTRSLWRCCCNEHKQHSRSESWWAGEALTHITCRESTAGILNWRSACCRRPPPPQLEDLLLGTHQEVPGCCCCRWDVEEGNKEGCLPAVHLALMDPSWQGLQSWVTTINKD